MKQILGKLQKESWEILESPGFSVIFFLWQPCRDWKLVPGPFMILLK